MPSPLGKKPGQESASCQSNGSIRLGQEADLQRPLDAPATIDALWENVKAGTIASYTFPVRVDSVDAKNHSEVKATMSKKSKEISLDAVKKLVSESKWVSMSLNSEYTMSDEDPLLWVRVPKGHANKVLNYWKNEDSDAKFKVFFNEDALHIHTPYSVYRT